MFLCCWVDENTETSSLSHVISLRDWNRKQWCFVDHSMEVMLPSWAVYLLELWFFVMIYRARCNSSRDPPLRQTGWNVTKHSHRCIDLLGCGQYALFSVNHLYSHNEPIIHVLLYFYTQGTSLSPSASGPMTPASSTAAGSASSAVTPPPNSTASPAPSNLGPHGLSTGWVFKYLVCSNELLPLFCKDWLSSLVALVLLMQVPPRNV